jgi:uncharacterized membrane protein YqjE
MAQLNFILNNSYSLMETALVVISIILALSGIWTIKELKKPAVMDRNGNWIKQDGEGL